MKIQYCSALHLEFSENLRMMVAGNDEFYNNGDSQLSRRPQ